MSSMESSHQICFWI